MKKRILSLVLCAAMLLSMCLFLGAGVMDDTTADGSAETTESYIPAVNFTNVAPFVQANAQAANGPARAALRAANVNAVTTRAADNGVVTSKTATANDDGTYTITLEAYATGSKVISEITKDIPTDIVLVLDQSGSMDDPMGTVSFEEYEDEADFWDTTYHTRNQDYYEYRHNGGSANLWHKLSDGTYRPVSVTREGVDYKKLSGLTNRQYNHYAENNTPGELYVKYGNEYSLVTVTADSSFSRANYTYKDANGKVIAKSSRANTIPDFSGIDGLYAATSYRYTYSYTDANGVMREIGSSTGVDTVFSPTLYKRTVDLSSGEKRLDALKNAVTTFAEAVAEKAAGKDGKLGTGDDIDHRIAVVGFASESGYGNNSELLSISGSNSGSVGVAYKDIKEQNLKDVLQSMKTAAGQTMVTSAINALAANGATRTDLGMDMAKRILSANPVPAGQERNRVVVVFTDGSPTDNNGFQLNIADSAITTADAIKTANATVYSIGIFSGADATSSGVRPSKDYTDGYYGDSPNYTAQQMTDACNWFMQNLSSNNGTVRNPSYYLSAADSDSLNSIFKQISDQIESGGSSSTLTGEAVVKDIISPQFQLPEGTTVNDINLETYACTGKTGDTYTWSKNANAMGANAKVEDGTVSVTGFDFAENYVGTVTNNDGVTYRGNKLRISFEVVPKNGFLGGNDVFTNDNAAIYDKSTATEPVRTFDDKPQVNVPIKDVTVTGADKNVYLLGDLTADQLKDGTTVKVGDVTLDLTKANDPVYPYGLKKWQTAYVNITVAVTDETGKAITDTGLSNLTDDTKYTVSVTVAPTKESPTSKEGTQAVDKRGTATPNVNVFKPELTFKDSEGYYGDTAPRFDDNLTSTVWKHGETVADTRLMGKAPELTLAFTLDTGAIEGGKINTRTDFGVDVTVKINNTDVTIKTAFLHKNCAGKTCELPPDKEFLVHVNTCSLTITKNVKGEGANPNQTFVFNVMKGGDLVTTVVLKDGKQKTITGLAVGDYTVVEDTNWSWSYTPDKNGKADVTLSNTRPNDEVKITNTAKENHWLTSIVDVINKWTDKNNIDNTRQVPGPGTN